MARKEAPGAAVATAMSLRILLEQEAVEARVATEAMLRAGLPSALAAQVAWGEMEEQEEAVAPTQVELIVREMVVMGAMEVTRGVVRLPSPADRSQSTPLAHNRHQSRSVPQLASPAVIRDAEAVVALAA